MRTLSWTTVIYDNSMNDYSFSILHLIDTHCHLDFEDFDADRNDVWQHAREQTVTVLILPATTCDRWPQVKSVAEMDANIYPAYGLHPCFMSTHKDAHIDELALWLDREKPVAVGECGLDFYNDKSNQKAQLDLLDAQLALANERNLPVIIHARKAVEDILQLLRQHPGSRGVLHSYSGSFEQAKILMDLGFYFGFGGPVTWPRSTRLQAVVKKIPLAHILLETDAPDQPDSAHKAQRNEPGFLPAIATFIAQLRKESIEKFSAQTTENARMLFSLPDHQRKK